jgi:uncharacterized protein YndB with AHSA1/START domain
MTKKDTGAEPGVARGRITIERTYRATLDDVWELWTTKGGIESWWGPGGVRVKVRKLDLRPGGELLYAMTAVEPAQVAFMEQNGMPLTQELQITFTAIEPRRRLAYVHLADFIPGVEPYDVATVVQLHPTDDGVRLVLMFDAMHDEEWTNRAALGWRAELERLTEVLER